MRVLFLCTGNAARSQMAEGWARHMRGGDIEAFSAGVEPKGLAPLAVKVMAEAGIDISGYRSKSVSEFFGEDFDYAVTLCDGAKEKCPIFPKKTRLVHRGFEDPHALEKAVSGEEERLAIYRRTRDEIRDFVANFPESAGETPGAHKEGQDAVDRGGY